MNGRVVFSKDFLEKTKTPLSNKEKGRLRLKKIIEAEKEGKLSLARNRIEVGELVGIPKDQLTVINAWVHRQIKSGKLTETLLGFNDQNKPEFEYHFYENRLVKPKTSKKPIKTTITKEVLDSVKKPEITQVKTEPEMTQNKTPEVNIPLNKDILEKGLSLTLNINFTFNE